MVTVTVTCSLRVMTLRVLLLLVKVIVEYADVTAAMAGRQSMHGRRFAGRTVVATFLPEPAYGAGQF
jgi:hypothetical protein